jgi:hypothetical protein
MSFKTHMFYSKIDEDKNLLERWFGKQSTFSLIK